MLLQILKQFFFYLTTECLHLLKLWVALDVDDLRNVECFPILVGVTGRHHGEES
jgi:hypothetical protein